jgi:hypothetical protein
MLQHVEDSAPGGLYRCQDCGHEFRPSSSAGYTPVATRVPPPDQGSETYALLPDEDPPSRRPEAQPTPTEYPEPKASYTWVPLTLRFRVVLSLICLSLGFLFLFLRSHGYFEHFRQRSLVAAIGALVGGIGILFMPGYYQYTHTPEWDRWSQLHERVRRRAGERGLLRGLKISLPLLACVAGGWWLLAMVYLLGFAPTFAGVALFVSGPVVGVVGQLWLRRICIRDGVWEGWMTRQQRGQHTVDYVRQYPERAAKPFCLLWAGLLLFLISLVVIVLAERKF